MSTAGTDCETNPADENDSEDGKEDESEQVPYTTKVPYREDSPALNYFLDNINPIQEITSGDDIVIFNTRNHPHYNYMYPVFAEAFTKNDVPAYFLSRHKQIGDVFPDLTIDGVQISNSIKLKDFPFLYRSGQIGYPQYDWTVDLENELISADSLDANFYHVMLSTLRFKRRRYNIDFNETENIRDIQKGLFTADELIRYCQLLLTEAERRDLTITFVGWENEYVPNGLLWMIADSEDAGHRLQYMKIGTLYAHYFGENFSDNFSATSMTGRKIYHPFAGYEEEFENYKQSILSDDNRLEEVKNEMETELNENILKDVNPIRALTGEDQKQLKERIDSYREEDAQIFALFGHKFFDLFLYDESPAFENMCDWIDTTLGIFQDRDDLLILKPHPAEFSDVDHNPAPNETLADYVKGKIEQYSNILLLEPRDVSAAALYSEIDCGLVWTSSVGLEMACFGIPMIVSGSARYRSYVDLPYTKSKSQYRKQIKRASSIIIQPRVQTNASIYLHFEKNYRHIHCPYVKNVNYKKFRADQLEWNKEAVNEFLEIGHPQLEESIMTELTIPKQK